MKMITLEVSCLVEDDAEEGIPAEFDEYSNEVGDWTEEDERQYQAKLEAER